MDLESELTAALRRALRACREENWWLGLQLLTELEQRFGERGELPGYYFSYLGVALARCRGEKVKGLRLCRLAAEQQPLQPENHLNLATLYLMVRNRRAAIRAIHRGQAIDPDHPGLSALASRLGVRRRPIVPFLRRSHPLNRVLGGIAQRWSAAGGDGEPRSEPA